MSALTIAPQQSERETLQDRLADGITNLRGVATVLHMVSERTDLDPKVSDLLVKLARDAEREVQTMADAEVFLEDSVTP